MTAEQVVDVASEMSTAGNGETPQQVERHNNCTKTKNMIELPMRDRAAHALERCGILGHHGAEPHIP